jgi:hypothetical protein
MAAPPAGAKETPLQHARHVVAFFDRHRAAAATPPGQRALWDAIHVLSTAVRSLQSAGIYPPHHKLWKCISRYEGSWTSRRGYGPGYRYGGLQMSWGWLGWISGNPADHSEAEQEWAAENAWRSSGYAYNFLYGQWYEWDNADGCGTTG